MATKKKSYRRARTVTSEKPITTDNGPKPVKIKPAKAVPAEVLKADHEPRYKLTGIQNSPYQPGKGQALILEILRNGPLGGLLERDLSDQLDVCVQSQQAAGWHLRYHMKDLLEAGLVVFN